MDSLENLAMDVQTAPSQLEKARAEKRFLQSVVKGSWAWEERVTKLVQMSGETFKHIQLRQRLLNASPHSDYLWSMIESGQLNLYGAVVELRAYEINNGLVKYKRTSIKSKRSSSETESSPSPGKKETKRKPKFPIKKQVISLSGKVKIGLKKTNPSLSDDELNSLTETFTYDVENLIRSLRTKACRKSRINQAIINGIEYKELMSVHKACELLNIDKPRKGKFVNLDKAKVNMKARVFQYHPDRNSGNEDAPKHIQDFVEAYEILKSYNENLEQSNT